MTSINTFPFFHISEFRFIIALSRLAPHSVVQASPFPSSGFVEVGLLEEGAPKDSVGVGQAPHLGPGI